MAADEAIELHKAFIREMTQRIEQGGREIVRALGSLGADLREETRLYRLELGELREEMLGLHEDMRDLRAESRAQTDALLRMLDRLDNGGPAAAGA